MIDANGKATPFPNGTEYHAPTDQDKHMPETIYLYWKVIGDVRYIADSTRPDIALVAGRLGAASASPTERNWHIMKATLRYLKRTRKFGLFFCKETNKTGIEATCTARALCASADACWASDKVDRKSVTGSFIAWRGRPVGWVARKQDAIAMSTAEPEYREMTDVMQRAVYTQALARTFEKQKPAVQMENDNLPAITMLNAIGRTK